MDLCLELRDESDLVKNQMVTCWILDLNEFIKNDSKGSKELPLESEDEFNAYLKRFVSEDENGIDHLRGHRLGFDLKTGQLKYMHVLV